MRRLRVIPVALLAAVLSAGLAGAHPADPFKGAWQGTDPGDGSNVTVSFGGDDSTRQITLFDDFSTICGGGTLTAQGVGTVDGNEIAATVEARCPGQGIIGAVDTTWTFDPVAGTLTDHPFGVVYSRPGS